MSTDTLRSSYNPTSHDIDGKRIYEVRTALSSLHVSLVSNTT